MRKLENLINQEEVIEMCGICGIILSDESKTINPTILQDMRDVMRHRGPDDEGIFLDRNIGFAVRRLDIIDLLTGHQPIHNEDESVWIVFNGEIYNYRELRKDLESKGHIFYTNTDTEVIVHLYEELSVGCVMELNGMFAFAIWDKKENKLFLARDRIGEKPLHYSVFNGNLIFASEIKSILRYPQIDKSLDFSSIDDYFSYLYVPAPKTIFKDIKKLLPGHTLLYHKGRLTISKYWDINFKFTRNRPEEYFSEHLYDLLKTAVRRRLNSDVPLGAFLSGGVDSSVIVGLMSQVTDEPVRTFSLGFDVSSYNELKYARVVSKHFGTKHNEFIVRPDSIKLLPQIMEFLDEPFADCSIIPTYIISKLAKEKITVALSGDGGDELFCGYSWTSRQCLIESYGRLPLFIKKSLNEFSRMHVPRERASAFIDRFSRFVNDVSISPLEGYRRRVSCFSKEMKDKLYSQELKRRISEDKKEDVLKEYFHCCAHDAPIVKMLYADLKMFLPDDGLAKIDRMSMANSLEVRTPFLDHVFVEFISTIPYEFKIKGLITKYILKRAFKNFLPPQILKQRKQGFVLPLHHWFRGELTEYVEEILLSESFKWAEFFNKDYISYLIVQHRSGKQDLGTWLWTLLIFKLWMQRYLVK